MKRYTLTFFVVVMDSKVMFKRAVIAAILAATPFGLVQASSCTINYSSSSNAVFRALEQGFNFKNYERVCKKLKAANAGLQIDGHITVLDGVASAWAYASVKDRNLEIHARDYGGSSTTVNRDASMSTAANILPESINSAIESIELEAAIEKLNANRKQARAAYRK